MKLWTLAAGLLAATLALLASPSHAADKTCLWVDSYHAGYEWSDGIGKGIEDAVKGKCALETFHMDTKRNNDKAFMAKKGEEVKAMIDAKKFDVVILSDDNSVINVLMPFYKDAKFPIVFTGLNWKIDHYGLPTKNTTGMIEVAPVQPMVQELKKALPAIKTMAFVSSENETERKDFDQIVKILKASGIDVKPYFASDFEGWKKEVSAAQKEDFVYLGNNAGIKNWDNAAATDFVVKNNKKFSGSTYDWMAPYVSFVMAKSAYEQGEFAGTAAAQILGGKAPNSIQVATNKKYDPIVNHSIYDKSGVKLSADFLAKAKPYAAK